MNKRTILLSIIILAIATMSAPETIKAETDSLTITKACASGNFSVFVDCQSGGNVIQTAGPGNHQFGVAGDKKSFKVLIDGGSGSYDITAFMSDGSSLQVASYSANAKTVVLDNNAKELGWKLSELTVYAPTIADSLDYPIVELGSCKDKQDCYDFCNKSENMMACVDYASAKGMIDEKEVSIAKKAIPKIIAGETPGGCRSKEQCEDYCQNSNEGLAECVAFAEEMGILPPEELAQAKKVAKAFQEGIAMPGNCVGKKSCEQYCADSSHMEECLIFAEKSQILPAEEIAEARKVLEFMKSGETPGRCDSKSSCKDYCAKDENFEECILFAEKAGFVSAEEAVMAHKVGGKGPGGCKGKDECLNYCDTNENAKECADFAIEKGLVSKEEEELIKNGTAKLKAGLEQVPAEVRSDIEQCLRNTIGNDNLAKLNAGQDLYLTKKQGESIGPCFESALAEYAEKQAQVGAPNAPTGSSGPGTPSQNTGSGQPSIDCSQFSSVPSCSYVGSVGSTAYDICKQCFPNK